MSVITDMVDISTSLGQNIREHVSMLTVLK